GGFNAERYPAVFNDVDLWLKLRTAGYRCVYNPLVKAIHYESKSRGREHSGDAVFHQRLIEDWGTSCSAILTTTPTWRSTNTSRGGGLTRWKQIFPSWPVSRTMSSRPNR